MHFTSFSCKMLAHNIDSIKLLMRTGKITPQDLFNTCLKRSKFVNQLNSFISLAEDSANIKENSNGPLSGVPIAVKDNFCTNFLKTTCASRMLEDFTPPYNATVVQKLIDAGASIVGKCNMDEFAMGSGTVVSHYGPTTNIWRSNIPYAVNGKQWLHTPEPRIAGGSSGGSAVAVATGACFASLGSDTGGSTRNPAAHCGVIGFKPTYSTVSRHGLIPLCNSMDVPSIFARSVPDTTLVYSVIFGRDPLDATSVDSDTPHLSDIKPANLKVGIPKEYSSRGLSSEVRKTWEKVASIFENHGATVVQVSLPHTPYSISCYSILNQAEVASNMARFDGLRYGLRCANDTSTESMYAESRSKGFGHVVRSRILSGNYFLLQRNYEKYFMKAMKVRRLIAEDFEKVWQSVDVLLTPTTLTSASRLSDFINLDNREQCIHEDYCTQPSNLAGVPAISLPVELSGDGLPLAVQLVAPNFRDSFLLSVSAWLERKLDFPKLEILDS